MRRPRGRSRLLPGSHGALGLARPRGSGGRTGAGGADPGHSELPWKRATTRLLKVILSPEGPLPLLIPEKKIIAVVGATGAQGGGLVRAILRDAGGHYQARAITRDPHSEKAQQLASLGAEVVAVDVDDENSLT